MDFHVLTDMLSEKVKQQICRKHQSGATKLEFLLDHSFIRQLWSNASDDEKKVIRHFLLHKSTDFLSYREIDHKDMLPIPAARFRVALTKWRQKGVIYTLRRLWGELAYIIPHEMVRDFRKILVPIQTSAWEWEKPIPSIPSYHILDGVFQVLNYVRHHPVELTKKGTLSKKNLRLFQEKIGLTANDFAFFKKMPDCLQAYENHEAIFLDLLTECGLLCQSGDRLELGDMETFLAMSHNEGQRMVMEKLPRYLELSPKLDFFYDLILGLELNRCYSLCSILQSMGEFAPSAKEAVENVLTPLQILGIASVSLGEGDGDCGFVIHGVEDEIGGMYVQPNFEILLPSFSPLGLKWKVAAFSQLLRQEKMWTFIIHRQMVQTYFEAGNMAEMLIEQLQAVSTLPIPENVQQTIQSWQQHYRQIHFFDARIMEVSDSRMADEIEENSALSPFLLQRLGDRFISVRLESWEMFVGELNRRGYTPGMVKPSVNQQIHKKQPLQIFKKEEAKGAFKVESIFPDLEDAIPGMKQIPKMWIANFQHYHGSTLRDLVAKALQLEIELRLDWKGKEVSVQPKSLLNREGNWILQANDTRDQCIECPLEEIRKIQVLLP